MSREFKWEAIVRSAVRTAAMFSDEHLSGRPVWFAVAERCGVGSTSAIELCRRFDIDPHRTVPETRFERVARLCEADMEDGYKDPVETCQSMFQHIMDAAPEL